MSRPQLLALVAAMAVWRWCWLYPLHALYLAGAIEARAEFERLAMLPLRWRRPPGQPPSGPSQLRS